MRFASETNVDGHLGVGHHGGLGHAPHGFELGHGAPIVNHAQGHHHHGLHNGIHAHHEPHGHIHEPIKHHDHGIGEFSLVH